MTSVNIEIDNETIMNRVVQVAFDRFCGSEFSLSGINTAVHERIAAEAMPAIKTEVASWVQNVLSEPFVPTNLYGEKKGEAKTIREVAVKEAKAYLTEHVDEHGRSVSSYSRATKMTRVVYEARAAVQKAIAEQVKTLVQEAVTAEIERVSDETLAPAIRSAVRAALIRGKGQ